MFTPIHALNDPNAMKDYNFLPNVGFVALESTANDAIIEPFSCARQQQGLSVISIKQRKSFKTKNKMDKK